MHSQLLWTSAGERSFTVMLEPGEEPIAALTRFAIDRGLCVASLTASGVFERATLAWFDLRTQSYRPFEIDRPCKALSLTGRIWSGDDVAPILRIHAIVHLFDGTVRGGHLLKAVVRTSLEATVVETRAAMRRRLRPETGIALIAPA
jgi:predicted DNA-binding protein with PD1-like motif